MIREIRVNNIEELFDTLRLSNTSLWGNGYPSDWLFRGQANCDWQLLPSLWRSDSLESYSHIVRSIKSSLEFCKDRIHTAAVQAVGKNISADLALEMHAYSIFHYEMIGEFRYFSEDLALISSEERWLDHGDWRLKSAGHGWYFSYPKAGGRKNIELVSLAQHSGMPTSMLDWTLDPIKALVFATEHETTSNPVVWAINRRNITHNNFQTLRLNPHPEYHVGFNFYDPPRRDNVNANFQDGVLMYLTDFEYYMRESLIFPSFSNVIESYTNSIKRDIDDVIIKIILEEGRQLDILEVTNRLFRERKTLSHLMPNLDTCAKTAMKSIKNNMKGKFY